MTESASQHASAGNKESLLVTGANGVIGRLLLPELARHYQLDATDREASQHEGIAIRALDINDPSALAGAVSRADRVLHLAAIHLGHRKRLSPESYLEATVQTNVTSVTRLLALAAEAGVKRVVLFSSLTVHLGSPARQTVPADAPPQPNSLYACTKLFAEHLAEMHSRQDGLSSICARLGQPYPTLPWFGPDAMSDPANRACAADHADIVAGTLAALATPEPFGVFNLISDSDASVFDLEAGRKIGYIPQTRFLPDGPVSAN